jgi:hypothetical protein
VVGNCTKWSEKIEFFIKVSQKRLEAAEHKLENGEKYVTENFAKGSLTNKSLRIARKD